MIRIVATIALFSLSAACHASRPCSHENLASFSPVLRSAWMLTDRELRLPAWPSTTDAESRQLREHFLAVEAILIRNTWASLQTAVLRYEHAYETHLNSHERFELRT